MTNAKTKNQNRRHKMQFPERIREGVKALGGVIKQEMASRKGFELKG